MKKIVLIVIGLFFLSGFVSGYQVNIIAPVSLSIGKPLIVTGTTTLGIGTPIDVVLYYQETTTTEVGRKVVYVQSDKSFKTFFDTTNIIPTFSKRSILIIICAFILLIYSQYRLAKWFVQQKKSQVINK